MNRYSKVSSIALPEHEEAHPTRFRPTRRWAGLAGAICVLAGVALLTSVTNFDSRFTVWWQARKAASSTSSSPALKPEEMAILLKTGSGMRQRLEMHLQNEFAPGSPFTSFQVYSDYEHDVMGHHVVDALKDLNASAMQQEEWDLYQQHKADLDSGVSESDLDLKAGQHWFDGGRAGDNYSKSWGIDKYKFLPILVDAAQRFPDAKWFVFMDDDAVFMLENLRRWLAYMDFEGQLVFGEKGKEHPEVDLYSWANGKGFVLSKGFMDATFRAHPDLLLDDLRQGLWRESCCGDRELWRTLWKTPDLRASGTSEISNDVFKNDGKPERIRFDQHSWCRPKMISHKLEPQKIQDMLTFERAVQPLLRRDEYILNAHVFHAFAPSQLQKALQSDQDVYTEEDWGVEGYDFDYGDREHPTDTEEQCSEACLERDPCMTSTWLPGNGTEAGTCRLFNGWVMGQAHLAPTATTWRMDKLRAALKGQWCTP